MSGFTAMGGYEGEPKQRILHHQFPTLPTLQTPEQFQISRIPSSKFMSITGLFSLVTLGHLPNTSHVLQGTVGPPALRHTCYGDSG